MSLPSSLPADRVIAERVRQGADILQSWGLSVRFGPHALGSHDQLRYLSADDDDQGRGLRSRLV